MRTQGILTASSDVPTYGLLERHVITRLETSLAPSCPMQSLRRNTVQDSLLSTPVCLTQILVPLPIHYSVDEVDTEEVQQQASKHEIGKRPLVRDALELGLVLWVGLDAEGRCEDELADAGAEARQEGVERLGVRC